MIGYPIVARSCYTLNQVSEPFLLQRADKFVRTFTNLLLPIAWQCLASEFSLHVLLNSTLSIYMQVDVLWQSQWQLFWPQKIYRDRQTDRQTETNRDGEPKRGEREKERKTYGQQRELELCEFQDPHPPLDLSWEKETDRQRQRQIYTYTDR